jgi:hypothetical protein
MLYYCKAIDSADSPGYLWRYLQIRGMKPSLKQLANGMSASAAYVEAGYKASNTDALG